MARPRKNKDQGSLLTPDKIAEIPVEEQPYPLPKGWKWVRLGEVAEIVTGGTPSKKHPEYYGGHFPFFKPSDLDAGRHIFSASEYLTSEGKSRCRVIPANSIGICCIGSIGKSGYFDIECTTNQQINTAIPKFNSLYLYYYTKTLIFNNILWQKSSATTIAIVNKTKLESCAFPLPPLAEQQRIVERIESLFAKLDKAREKAQTVLDGFEIRKAAILHKAFTGELTEKWREGNNISLTSWEEKPISSLCHSLKYGTAKKSKSTGTIIVLRMGNLQAGEIDWNNLAYSDDHEDMEKYLLSPNDVLFNRTNSAELVGKTSIYRGEYPAIYAGYLIKMDYKKDFLSGAYLNYVMNSNKAKEYCNLVKSDGVNQSNINAKKLGAFVIPVPSLPEQQEITRILDSLLAKEQQVKEAAETVLEQIDLMKKAILARAFRGELG